MSNNKDETIATRLVGTIIDNGLDGPGPLSSSKELARSYSVGSKYPTVEAAIDSLIKWESARSFGLGFVTGLGGLVTLPISLPSDLVGTWIIQTRLIGAIAELRGWDTSDEYVRTFTLLSLLGNEGKVVVKEVMEKAGMEFTKTMIKRLPGRVLREINKKVGFKLVTKGGEKSLVTLTKMVPLVGGLIGGTVDGLATRGVGTIAKKTFPAQYSAPSALTLAA